MHGRTYPTIVGTVNGNLPRCQWHAYCEQILHSDFLRRQRQWEAEQARAAPHIHVDALDFFEEDQDQDFENEQVLSLHHPSLLEESQLFGRMDLSTSQAIPRQCDMRGLVAPDEAEIESRLAEEQKGVDALVAMHDLVPSVEELEDEVDAWNWMTGSGPASSNYGSQDESFEELLGVTVEICGIAGDGGNGGGDDAMDVSG